MRIALIHSQQPANQYTGGPVGTADSEQAWMRQLAQQVAPLLRAAGADVQLGPLGNTYRDNVRWVNASGPYDLLISLHSNALGDACVLWGPSSASAGYGRALMAALNAAAILPYGDRWTYNARKPSELTDTRPPAVLLEVGQHDRADYAAWLRAHITDGSLAAALTAAIAAGLGLRAPATTAITPEEDDMPITDADLRAIRIQMQSEIDNNATIKLVAGRAGRAESAAQEAASGVKALRDELAELRQQIRDLQH